MTTRSIPRVCDRHLIDVFAYQVLRDGKLEGTPKEVDEVQVYILGGEICIEKASFDDEGLIKDSTITALYKLDSEAINRIRIFYRLKGSTPIQNKRTYIDYIRSTNSFVDQLTADASVPKENTIFFAALLTALSVGVTGKEHHKSLQPELFSAHHEMLSRLESVSTHLFEDAHKQMRKLETEKSTFLLTQATEFEEKRQQLVVEFEERQARLEEQYFQKDQELKEREHAIEDADNTTARRQTTVSAITDVAERAKKFTFSTSVNSRMVFIVGLCLFLASLGLTSTWQALTVISSTSFSAGTDPNIVKAEAVTNSGYMWFNYIRVFLSSALVVSSLVYLIRFFSSWMNKVANQELDNQKYVRDLNRAHVAIEMCLEWNDKKDGTIPERLLSAVTEGLFVDKTQSNVDINHPAEQLASALIRTSDKLEFPLGTGTVTTSGKNINKAKADTQKARPESEVTAE
ncbi:hypothetical protein C9I92_01240 [Photobacterium ganghwense]|uniref:Uncharacterized protein n=1 Tax=Photobacterium ganghwense TaxID=320778 RepID=A0A0J1HAE7_9GAMM|nr:hypothetical protein [Photobacterium ganghwense]KLV08664.1 hypothetical protein ABT57_12605 [Photobacterium ganghwense]PSU10784.1 hypothetical protein C9I92_01240 [Photobacterium ganghwense]